VRKRSDDKVFSVGEVEGKLIIERRGEPFRKRYVVLIVLLSAVLGLLIGYIAASQLNARYWLLVLLVLLMLLVIAERAVRMYNATKPERFTFDKEKDIIDRNGERVGETTGVEAVLFRDVYDGDRPLNEHAVVLSYENTRRLLVAESHGLPGEREELETVANSIASYLDVPVRNEPRQADQWWIDRS